MAMQRAADAAAFDGQPKQYLKSIFENSSTSAKTTYMPPVDTEVHVPRDTPDLKQMVQEIVDLPGWAPGNAMAVLFGNPTGTSDAHSREYESFNGEPTMAPSLVVSFCQAPPVVTCPDGRAVQTVTIMISASGDDVEESIANTTNPLYTTSSDLELGSDYENYYKQIIGLRFPQVRVPTGATVTSAFVRFYVDAVGSCCNESFSVTMAMQRAADAAAFNGQPKQYLKSIFENSSTSARTTYMPPVDTEVHVPRDTPDLKQMVQEIVDLPGWAPGNAMAVLFGNPTGTSDAHSREYESFNGEPT
eukprot:CAMPEP_0204113472 /NCGR_PEP_ID=MMETSP0361-20130328/3674_1 /ASSEMBLY_ACC=CAM_ASM_000343 /TAXON_ID=268821 /ORGANISM="Scrippsiella Hangoei, Strain SHTV-5" /LENGTH=302 /DNA_ID=CAMNT_0051063837 /DNA_START=57 /DNA_END=961 /DNA_ORIENTATION=-